MLINLPHLFHQEVQEIIHSPDEGTLFKSLLNAVQMLGFDYYAYGVRIASPVTKPTFTLRNNYTNKWQAQYAHQDYLAIDPTVKHGLTSTRPFTWHNKLMQEPTEFWQEASAHGLKSGWAQSSILSPNSVGMLTVAREDERKTPTAITHEQPLLVWLNDAFKSTFAELILPSIFKETYIELTARETEMLKWCADGKTSDEIAIILNVTKRTVDFHIANTLVKLNVSNKTAAAVRAIQLNLL